MSDLLNSMRDLARFGCPLAAFVLEQGRRFEAQPLPKGIRRGRQKLCFMNATHLCLGDPTLSYVEGYAARQDLDIPIKHAWCVDENSMVIDTTWRDPERCEYRGVIVPTDAVLDEVNRLGYYGVLSTRRGANVDFMARLMMEKT